MKEATGELNMTVITVVIIAALALIGTAVVLPAITAGIKQSSCASIFAVENDEVTVNGNKCCLKNDPTNCVTLEE